MDKTKTKRTIMFIVACVVVFAIGFLGVYLSNSARKKPKEFDTDMGLSITLTKEFSEFNEDHGHDYALISNNIGFMMDMYTFDFLDNEAGYYSKTMTNEVFCQIQIDYFEVSSEVKFHEQSGLNYFEYRLVIDGEQAYYFAFSLRSSNAFYVCQFTCDGSDANKYFDKFIEWAGTAKYAKQEASIPETKSFETQLGVTIALNEEYIVETNDQTGFLAADNLDTVVAAVAYPSDKYDFVEITDLNAKDFANAYLIDQNIDGQVIEEDGLVYFILQEDGTYMANFFYKGEDKFYMCSFMCDVAKAERLLPIYKNFAKTCTVV